MQVRDSVAEGCCTAKRQPIMPPSEKPMMWAERQPISSCTQRQLLSCCKLACRLTHAAYLILHAAPASVMLQVGLQADACSISHPALSASLCHAASVVLQAALASVIQANHS